MRSNFQLLLRWSYAGRLLWILRDLAGPAFKGPGTMPTNSPGPPFRKTRRATPSRMPPALRDLACMHAPGVSGRHSPGSLLTNHAKQHHVAHCSLVEGFGIGCGAWSVYPAACSLTTEPQTRGEMTRGAQRVCRKQESKAPAVLALHCQRKSAMTTKIPYLLTPLCQKPLIGRECPKTFRGVSLAEDRSAYSLLQVFAEGSELFRRQQLPRRAELMLYVA